MVCPKCGKGEVDDSGTCPECGSAAASGSPEQEAARQPDGDAAHVGLIPMDYTGPSGENGAELPAWRQELSRRLQEIKRKREAVDQPPPGSEGLHSLSELKERTAEPAPVAAEPPRKRVSRPRPVPALAPVSAAPSAQDGQARLADDQAGPAGSEPPPAEPAAASEPGAEPEATQVPAASPRQANIQDLIDSIMTRKSEQAGPEPRIVPPPSAPECHGEGKLILLSRTLSGLVDLLIVILCTGAFILGADFVSGIEVLDNMSLIHYAQLLLAIFLLYSIFMLGTANQTMGMMITDLKVTRPAGERPSIGQIALRTVAFLVSLLALGIGLVWAIFDRKSLCLHDRISGTEVIRM